MTFVSWKPLSGIDAADSGLDLALRCSSVVGGVSEISIPCLYSTALWVPIGAGGMLRHSGHNGACRKAHGLHSTMMTMDWMFPGR